MKDCEWHDLFYPRLRKRCSTKNYNMKKMFLSMVGSMLISVCLVQAQERSDTTGTASGRQQQNDQYEKSRQKSDRTRYQNNERAQRAQGDRNQYSDQYANEGMVIIDKNEMPSSLKQTLQQKKYAGWENGTIYHNTNTGEYVIAPRAYRFDQKGKEIEMGNSPAYGNREGRQGRYSTGDRNAQDQSQPSRNQRDDVSQQNDAQSAQSQTQQSDTTDQARQSQGEQSSQQPSSSYRTDRNNPSGQNAQSDRSDQPQSEQPSQRQYRTEDMVEIQAEQVPEPLRRTLGESQYKGWEENGTLYQDPSSSEYVLEMQSTNDASQPRIYRFDKNGQLKPGQNGTGNSDQ
jgi:hypothetical protein